MVALSASGELVTLEAAGDAGAGRWVSASGDGRFSGEVLAELILCHGVSAGLGVSLGLELEGRLGALWLLAASGEGTASAQANASVRGLFSGNVFDDFGVALHAGAGASLVAAGRVAVGLDVGGVAEIAAALLDEDALALDLFRAFLNEARIEGGVAGRVHAGATAVAQAAVAGNLLADPARIEIAIDADAAAGTGAGAGAFFHCELVDPKRWATSSAELLSGALAAAAREHLPASAHPLVEYLEVILPAAFGIAWEVGEITLPASIGSPEDCAERVVAVVAGRLQRWVLDRGVDLGLHMAADRLRGFEMLAVLRDVADTDRELLADALDAVADGLSGGPVSLDRVAEIAADVLGAVGAALGPETERDLRFPLALAWTAAATVVAIRDPAALGVAGAGLTWSPPGGRPVDLGHVGDGPTPVLPPFVRREWTRLLGRPAGRTGSLAECVDVLLAAGLGNRLSAAPLLRPLLGDLAERLDISAGELVHAALAARVGAGLHTVELYHRLRALLADGIDQVVAAELLPRLRAELPDGDATRRWIDEAAEPCLLALRDVVLDRTDALVDGLGTGDLDRFLTRFRTVLGVLAAKIALRNVEVLAAILVRRVVEELPGALRDAAGQVSLGRWPLLSRMQDALAALVPPDPLGVSPTDPGPALRVLVAGLLETAALIVETWTLTRLAKLRALQQRCLRIDDLAVDWADADSVEELVEGILDCSSVPDPAAVPELAELLFDVAADQLRIAVDRIGPLLLEFLTTITTPWVDGVRDDFLNVLDGLDQGLEAAAEAIDVADAHIQDAAADASVALREMQDHLRAAEVALRSPQVRAEVTEQVRVAGREVAVALLGPAGGTGFDLAWSVFGGIVDPALTVLGEAGGWLADVVGSVADGVGAVAAVEAELARRARAALLGVDFGDLARFLGIEDVVAAASGAARRPAVRDELLAASHEARERTAALARGDDASRDRAIAEAKQRLLRRRRDDVHDNVVTPKLLAPDLGPLTGTPQVRVQLPGGDARLLQTPVRVAVLLNGRALTIGAGHLRRGRAGPAELRRPLLPADGLRRGVNVVEVAVVQPAPKPPSRVRAAFGWYPDRARPGRRGGRG